MKKCLFLLCALICFGCTYDYEINDDIKNFKPKVVVNSIIHPNEPIKAVLFWSRHYTERGDFKKVSTFDAELYEDGVLVAQTVAADSIMETTVHPKVGKKYRLKITVPNYGEVTAETYIPAPTAISATYLANKDGGYGKYQHVRIEQLVASDEFRAVWVRCFGEYENGDIEECDDLYSNSPFPDQINAVLDSDEATARGSNVGFEYFIRVPYQNLGLVLPLDFSVWLYNETMRSTDHNDPPLDEEGNPIWTLTYKLNFVHVEVLTPSDDYDKYFKTRYKQSLYDYAPDLPFVSEIVPVYCNIQNGLGIFAGYSKKNINLKPTFNE